MTYTHKKLSFIITVLLIIINPVVSKSEVELIAPGVISSDQGEHSPTFDVNRNELVFMRRTPGLFDYTLHTSKLIDGIWSKPEVLPFSGTYRDGGAAFSPDGNTLVYDSKRPTDGLSADSINIWRADRVENGWSKPKPLTSLSVNDSKEIIAGRDEFGPKITSAGDVIFYSFRKPNRDGAHYIAKPGDIPEISYLLPDPSADTFIGYLTLSTDGKTAVIEGRSLTGRDTDLFYACKKGDKWSQSKPLSFANSSAGEGTPYLTSDSQWLWFSSSRKINDQLKSEPNIYRINTKHLPIPCD